MNITAAEWELKHSKRLLVELSQIKWWQFKKKRDKMQEIDDSILKTNWWLNLD